MFLRFFCHSYSFSFGLSFKSKSLHKYLIHDFWSQVLKFLLVLCFSNAKANPKLLRIIDLALVDRTKNSNHNFLMFQYLHVIGQLLTWYLVTSQFMSDWFSLAWDFKFAVLWSLPWLWYELSLFEVI